VLGGRIGGQLVPSANQLGRPATVTHCSRRSLIAHGCSILFRIVIGRLYSGLPRDDTRQVQAISAGERWSLHACRSVKFVSALPACALIGGDHRSSRSARTQTRQGARNRRFAPARVVSITTADSRRSGRVRCWQSRSSWYRLLVRPLIYHTVSSGAPSSRFASRARSLAVMRRRPRLR